MPEIDRAVIRYGGPNGLTAICVVLSEDNATRKMLDSDECDIQASFVIDKNVDDVYVTASAYGVMGTPTSFLIGKNGKILWIHVGPLTLEAIRPAIKRALE
jgi:citrate lyase alpha subunit